MFDLIEGNHLTPTDRAMINFMIAGDHKQCCSARKTARMQDMGGNRRLVVIDDRWRYTIEIKDART